MNIGKKVWQQVPRDETDYWILEDEYLDFDEQDWIPENLEHEED